MYVQANLSERMALKLLALKTCAKSILGDHKLVYFWRTAMRIKRENMRAAQLVVGQIKIGGKDVDSEGRVVPYTRDYFSITGRETDGVGRSLPHPVFQSVLKHQSMNGDNDPQSLTELNVVIPSDHIDFFMQSNYEVWGLDTNGMNQKVPIRVCVGDGEQAQRQTMNGLVSEECPSCTKCEFGLSNGCKLMSRLFFALSEHSMAHELFVLRTASTQSSGFLGEFFEQIKSQFQQIAGLQIKLRLQKCVEPTQLSEYFIVRASLADDYQVALKNRDEWRLRFGSEEAFLRMDNDRFNRLFKNSDGYSEEHPIEVVEFYPRTHTPIAQQMTGAIRDDKPAMASKTRRSPPPAPVDGQQFLAGIKLKNEMSFVEGASIDTQDLGKGE